MIEKGRHFHPKIPPEQKVSTYGPGPAAHMVLDH